MSPSRRQAVNFSKCAFILVQSKLSIPRGSDKHESSLTLRVALNKRCGSVPHTTTIQLPWVPECSTNDKLCVLVKAQPSTRSTWPRSPTRLGIRPRDLGLLNKYSLGHCGLSAASRHKFAFTSRHYPLLTATTLQHSTKLLFVFFCFL